MNTRKEMHELLRQDSFTDGELNYAYHFMDTLQKMLKSLGTEYNAIWRTVFSDMRSIEEMMFQRHGLVFGASDKFEYVPEGDSKGHVVNVNLKLTINNYTDTSHLRNRLIDSILNMSEKDIQRLVSDANTAEEDDILNALQDNL